MIFRFSLYGFLKNQRYFEAFLYLAFLAKGLDFFQIGLLVACRQLAVNLFEIPSGSIADVFGRRRAMVLSLSAYIASFLVLGSADGLGLLAAGMALYGVGDSFRSGTHKAMIFTWLNLEGRGDERVKVYGYTRSWSKFGSAVSVVIGAVILLLADDYSWIFYVATVPYVLGVINILGYPHALDACAEQGRSLSGVVQHMATTVKTAFTRVQLRRLVVESMGFDGVFAAVKDYLQPVLEAAAVATVIVRFAGTELSETRRAALVVGPVYVVLFLLAGLASRRAHVVSKVAGSDDRGARILWGANAIVFAGLLAFGWFDIVGGLVGAFIIMHVLQNLWRPVLISRFDAYGDEALGASLLSIESQAQRAATMVMAPLLGLAVDTVVARGMGGHFWPIGALGLVVSIAFFFTARSSRLNLDPEPDRSYFS